MSRKNSHQQLVKFALKNQDVKRAYDELAPEFDLLRTMIAARRKAKKTQADIAESMQTTTSVIGRLESFNNLSSPTIGTLKKYAEAVNCDLKIRIVPRKQKG